MKVTARFYVRIDGWVTVTREVDSFDRTKADEPRSTESDILDAMADEAVLDAAEHLNGEVDGTEVIEVTP